VTEQSVGGGAAFWAARGVRIEPEPSDEEFEEGPEGPEGPVPGPPGFEGVTGPGAVPGGVPGPAPEPSAAQQSAPPAHEDVPGADAHSVAGFPQLRASVAGPAPAAALVPAQPALGPDGFAADTAPGSDPAAEPSWQLTGGELANPLPPLKTCLEAILMVVDEPIAVVTLAQVLERPSVEVAEALTELAEEYTVLGRGFELREVGLAGEGSRTGWRVYSRADCAPVVERFVRDGQQAKLTQAALETLAVVAYRQPVSRSKVSAIRGVNCDGVMRTLLARGLVEEYGADPETGALLYQTTGYFLERMGLKSLDELPELAPLLPSAAEVDVEDFA